MTPVETQRAREPSRWQGAFLVRPRVSNTKGMLFWARSILGSRCFPWLCLLLCLGVGIHAAEVMPPKPPRYFNDYAKVVSSSVAEQLNQTLEKFERDTSNQILVAVFPKMQSDSSIEDYTVRVAQSWKVGQAGKDNGAVLFVFIQDRQMFLQVGYGLEGVLPDAIAKRIIENEIKPHFRNGKYDAGLNAGVTAILQAARGEYKGSGRTVADRRGRGGVQIVPILFLIIFVVVLASAARRRGGTMYRRSGRTHWGGWGGGNWGGGSWGGGGGGGFSGGGFSGGGFSGGGGSFGGGGAGGRW